MVHEGTPHPRIYFGLSFESSLPQCLWLVLDENNSTFVLFDIFLVADSSDQPDFLIGEGFPTLFEHVGVTDMEGVEDPISI